MMRISNCANPIIQKIILTGNYASMCRAGYIQSARNHRLQPTVSFFLIIIITIVLFYPYASSASIIEVFNFREA